MERHSKDMPETANGNVRKVAGERICMSESEFLYKFS